MTFLAKTTERYRSPGRRLSKGGTFTPTKPAMGQALPDKVEEFLDSMNRKERRAFLSKARRDHRHTGREIAHGYAKLAGLIK